MSDIHRSSSAVSSRGNLNRTTCWTRAIANPLEELEVLAHLPVGDLAEESVDLGALHHQHVVDEHVPERATEERVRGQRVDRLPERPWELLENRLVHIDESVALSELRAWYGLDLAALAGS